MWLKGLLKEKITLLYAEQIFQPGYPEKKCPGLKRALPSSLTFPKGKCIFDSSFLPCQNSKKHIFYGYCSLRSPSVTQSRLLDGEFGI